MQLSQFQDHMVGETKSRHCASINFFSKRKFYREELVSYGEIYGLQAYEIRNYLKGRGEYVNEQKKDQNGIVERMLPEEFGDNFEWYGDEYYDEEFDMEGMEMDDY